MGLISKIEDKLSGHSGKEAEKQVEKQGQNYINGQHGSSGGGLQQHAEKQYAKHEMSNAMGGSGGNSSGLVGGLEQKAQGLSLGSSGATGGRGAPGVPTEVGGGHGHPSSGISPQTAERYGAPGASGSTSGTTGAYGAGAGAAGADLSSGGGSRSHDLRHPVGSGGHSGYIPPTGSAVDNPMYPGNGGQRVTSGSSQGSGAGLNKTQAREPYDPYSSAGQRTAADAAPNVGSAGYSGPGQAITHEQPRTSYDEQGVPRTAHGGVANSATQPATVNDRNFISGPTSYISNPEAVPTAGGRTLGDGQDSHTGRDAALGAGAAGAGAYGLHEEQKHGHHHGHHGQSSSTQPSSASGAPHHDSRHTAQGPPDTIGRSYEHTPSSANQHHYGRDAAIATGAAGAGAYGVHEAAQHHHHAQGDTVRPQAQTEPALWSQNYGGQGVGNAQPLSSQGGAYTQGAVDAQRTVGSAPVSGGMASSTTQTTPSNTTGSAVPSSAFDPKKMGSAYEAGYRDALAHMEAERQRLSQQ
ncbi:hypothetical protein Tdes44962_MAKER09576 [Teratosphaeria destructans]|uniref:Uncharacterized protein n=1 Tax=Teratosphaeria destructans TaxID=418781 RepID=A0A9W7SSL7_9PEZI|nr:hypothetical protein Tdes44962_MAKER09576 [Teratosphaeria destructans]